MCWRCYTLASDGVNFDGATAPELESILGLRRVELFDSVTSTMDVAHGLAGSGAPGGTLVLTDRQTAGRGRAGRSWASAGGSGVWLTMIERPRDTSGLDVLSLRVGLALAGALDRFAPEPIRLKWPNDLYVDGGKLGGILVEARWREQAVEWVAIGVGVNVRQPEEFPEARALDPGTPRIDVLREVSAAIGRAAASTGPLGVHEMEEFNARDLARGRLCTEPALGRVVGITPAGELLIALADSVAPFRSGSLVLAETEGEPR